MRSLLSVYRMPIRSYSPEGTFAAAACRLSDVTRGGFDGVLLSSFDGRAGTMDALVSLCSRLKDLGLCVLLDIASLYSGIGSPAPVLHAAVRQGLADGFVLSHTEWQYPDVREAVAAEHKEHDGLWFCVSDMYPVEGERPDGAARRGFSPCSLLAATDVDTAWCAELAAIGRGRGQLVTELALPAQTDDLAYRRTDLCLVLAWLLPGVPLVSPEALHAVQACAQPTDAARHAELRREALLAHLSELRRTYPSLALPQGALHSSCHEGTLTFVRRVSDGTLTVYARLLPTEGVVTDRTLLTVAPRLTSGVYHRDGRTCLAGYGFAVCFVPKAKRPPAAPQEETAAEETASPDMTENANFDLQNGQNTEE